MEDLSKISDDLIRQEYATRFQAKTGEQFTSSAVSARWATAALARLDQDREHFLLIHLDQQHKVITDEVLFSGTIDSSAVYPREIVKSVLANGTAAVVLAHNHPSGNLNPSSCDIAVTRKIQEALDTIQVDTLDHIIVGNGYYSFADSGKLYIKTKSMF